MKSLEIKKKSMLIIKWKYSKPLIPYVYDSEPKYFVFGGLTFSINSKLYFKLG